MSSGDEKALKWLDWTLKAANVIAPPPWDKICSAVSTVVGIAAKAVGKIKDDKSLEDTGEKVFHIGAKNLASGFIGDAVSKGLAIVSSGTSDMVEKAVEEVVGGNIIRETGKEMKENFKNTSEAISDFGDILEGSGQDVMFGGIGGLCGIEPEKMKKIKKTKECAEIVSDGIKLFSETLCENNIKISIVNDNNNDSGSGNLSPISSVPLNSSPFSLANHSTTKKQNSEARRLKEKSNSLSPSFNTNCPVPIFSPIVVIPSTYIDKKVDPFLPFDATSLILRI